MKEIFKYIAVDLQSYQTAVDLLECLKKAIVSLEQMPERYRLYDNPKWHERNLRVMPVKSYLVFYIPDHKSESVTVIRVMYGGRDIDKQLKSIE